MLNFNNVVYTLKLHEIDIWTHQATMSEQEMIIFIAKILHNNADIVNTIKNEFNLH